MSLSWVIVKIIFWKVLLFIPSKETAGSPYHTVYNTPKTAFPQAILLLVTGNFSSRRASRPLYDERGKRRPVNPHNLLQVALSSGVHGKYKRAKGLFPRNPFRRAVKSAIPGFPHQFSVWQTPAQIFIITFLFYF